MRKDRDCPLTNTTKDSLSAIVSVTVDDLLCDSLIHARPQFEQDIAELIEDCDDYEIRMVKDMTEALIPPYGGTPTCGNNTVNYVWGISVRFVPVLYSAFRLWLITASGGCVLARFPVHALTLPLVHVQQDVQFVQTGGLCFQLVLLRKWLLYLELCTGKLGLISGEVVLLGNEIALN